MNTKIITLIAISALLTSCAATSVKPKAVAKKAPVITDYSKIKPKNINAQATAYLNKYVRPTMKDPASMKITNFLAPKKEICRDGKGKYRVWSVIAGINGKNSYGAYTGTKAYKVYFKNGKPKDYAYSLLMGTDYSLPYCTAINF